ncbi:MAG TPA: 4Fe-4S dicluster domain-containing protein [bacterium]|nr:4Fe-4S dicluster domain-containing protein [bacterium]
MRGSRNIIEIAEELCDGCGQCIVTCAEGALRLVNGKTRLVGEVLCDGLGACIGECPTGALKITAREAEEFDEQAVEERLKELKQEKGRPPEAASPARHQAAPSFGCPSAREMEMTRKPADGDRAEAGPAASELRHWPIKIKLLRPGAPFLKGSDLLLLADCAGVSYPALHAKLLKGRAVAIGCPKLDDLEEHIGKLTEVLKASRPRSLTVGYMEVPCCRGFVYAAQQAIERSGVNVPLRAVQIGIAGEVRREEDLSTGAAECASCGGR